MRWEDEDWADFFRRYATESLVVTYEELAVAPEAVVRRTIEHLGVRRPARLRPEVWRHQRQADALTDAWVAQYHACDRAVERPASGALDPVMPTDAWRA